MGNIFSNLVGGSYAAEFFIDFENPQPTSGEEKVYGEIASLLTDGEALIEDIKDYKGCGDLQRAAMTQKTSDAETKCFEALLVSVGKINDFFQFARRLENLFPRLLAEVCTTNSEGKETIAEKQALAYQVGAIFSFVLRFDQLRMMKSALPNDFSYYRRLLGKFATHPDIVVDSDSAASMGMFTAEHTPMLSAISKAAEKALKSNSHIGLALALMANSCLSMINTRAFSNPETNVFCAQSMTGAIVLYDRITEFGVFHKRSPVRVKACITLLTKQFTDHQYLANNIRYCTKTYRQAPSGIQALFD